MKDRISLSNSGSTGWNQRNLVEATGGKWLSPPKSKQWRATGLCIFPPSMQPGQIVAIRPRDGKGLIPPSQISRLPFTPQALIVSEEFNDLHDLNIPTILVKDCRQAVIDMGIYSRNKFKGTVIGVTGSAGKTTTVALLQHLLNPWGKSGKSEFSANLPMGISWNLASISWDTRYAVIEMAIGNMIKNSAIVRPDIAIISNIHEAHIEYHKSTEEIAKKKSGIFSSMTPGSFAIINRDIKEWDILKEAANDRKLKIISFGLHKDAQFRILDYDRKSGETSVNANGSFLSFTMGGAGFHMAMNGIASLAVLDTLDLDLKSAAHLLKLFTPIAGRGVVSTLNINGKYIDIIDDAYNANPASVRAAIQTSEEIYRRKNYNERILILGDMLELGDQSILLHKGLSKDIIRSKPDRVILLGDKIQSIQQELSKNDIVNAQYNDLSALQSDLKQIIDRDQLILIKGSHGTGLHKIVKHLHGLSQN
ncbi:MULTISPECIES: UDP-N-acetylmuramoyl-tripeptide--D-alanyl-D-alanine ligase [Microbulbifer]|uniref:UDP-N-acetylmuramoyl-tripeptide--D-alanyl-D-alanine ligase n=1 Tax=Microbulbifer celer TaxID=435905 RepID=A0ABW3UBK9_9GAMM|nr:MULTISPECIES: UDP-N-acetylmuramoyl-tripeptide--D-alanyl-D-alanine ligase [Microbulbifer]UFN55760.1 UDP-N-acetylmuramoyl-tripeptide--D-alanyl-D-alanine ligase [Microbulbifer celer]